MGEMIKPFVIKHLDRIMDIWLQSTTSGHSFIPAEFWESRFEEVRGQMPASTLFFYEEEEIIKGFLGITEGNYIAGLFVAPEYQRQGIGTELIRFCKERYAVLELEVYAKNERALAFYRQQEFIIVSGKDNEETGEPEYKMVWRK